MSRRRTYRNPNGYPPPAAEEPVTDPPVAPGAPDPPRRSQWLKWTLSVAAGAVVGAVAVDLYRRHFGAQKNPRNDEDGAYTVTGAVPGAPSIMPMPMPMPLPMPMPMMPPAQLAPNFGAYDQRPMTDAQRLELARLEAEKAKAEAMTQHLKSWEDGDLD